jgi:hypothetical protein
MKNTFERIKTKNSKGFLYRRKREIYFRENDPPDCFWVMIRSKERATSPMKIQEYKCFSGCCSENRTRI